jgi:acetate kinase
MGGCDGLVFTGGIGENNPWLREGVCAGLGELGLEIDTDRNALGCLDEDLAADDSRSHVFAIAANEELVVARETHRHLLARS